MDGEKRETFRKLGIKQSHSIGWLYPRVKVASIPIQNVHSFARNRAHFISLFPFVILIWNFPLKIVHFKVIPWNECQNLMFHCKWECSFNRFCLNFRPNFNYCSIPFEIQMTNCSANAFQMSRKREIFAMRKQNDEWFCESLSDSMPGEYDSNIIGPIKMCTNAKVRRNRSDLPWKICRRINSIIILTR